MARKKTHEEFVAEVYEKVGNEYEVLGTYIGARKKVEMIHNICGHKWDIAPHSFLGGNRCPKCGKEEGIKKRTKSHEEFVARVYKLVGKEYEVLSKYKYAKENIKMKHHLCGYIYTVTPNDFFNGNRCPKCSREENIKRRTKTHEEFVKEVYDQVGDKYTVLSEYVNMNTKIKMLHNSCGYEYKITPNHFIYRKYRCKKCEGRFKTTERFKKEVFNLVGNEYEVLGTYIGANKEIKMRHKECDHEYNTYPSMVVSGQKCPKCFGKPRKNTEIFKKEIYDLYGDEYEVLGEYTLAKYKIKMKHNKCGNIWEVLPYNILHNSGCPQCNESKGEKAIVNWAVEHNIYFETQYIFEDCRDILPLKFDCAVFQKDNSIILIEYQGEQHEKPIKHMGGEKKLKERQKRDQIKRDYCKNNNIPLLEIWYWDLDNIDQILNKKLLPLDLMKQDQAPEPDHKPIQLSLSF